MSQQKQQIKVVIRTRPTPDFASKNIQFDQGASVSTFLSCLTYNFCVDCDCKRP
jgi:hypothetical protein